jgi:hypothetical protein
MTNAINRDASGIDFGRALSYPFEDRRWRRKLVVMFILSAIPGMNLIAWAGYAISTGRNIIRHDDYPMPEWESWSDVLVRGLLTLAAAMLYYAPALVIVATLWIVGLFYGATPSVSFVVIRCGLLFATGGYLAIATLILNTGHIRFAQTDQFNSYLALGDRIADLRRNTSRFVTLTVVQLVVSLVLFGLLLLGWFAIVAATGVVFNLGFGWAILVVPAITFILFTLVIAGFWTFLANGYFIGVYGVLITR